MPVPDFQSIMLPMLKLAADGKMHSLHQDRDLLANEFSLSDEELTERLPSGRQTTLANRVAWAKVYLVRAGLLESPERGKFNISDRGRNVLKQSPSRIDIKFLSQYPEFQDFRQPGGRSGPNSLEIQRQRRRYAENMVFGRTGPL